EEKKANKKAEKEVVKKAVKKKAVKKVVKKEEVKKDEKKAVKKAVKKKAVKKVEKKAVKKVEKEEKKKEEKEDVKKEEKEDVKKEEKEDVKKEEKEEKKKEEKEDVKKDETVEEEETFEEYTTEELINRLEELVKEEDINTIKTKLALIKVAFLKMLKEEKQTALDKFLEEGGLKEDYKPEENKLEARFNSAFEIYRKNKARYNERQEKLKLENLDKKKEILEKLKALIGSEETLKKTYDEFRTLQAEWKEIGMVPSGEVSNLWQNYHFLVEKFFDKVKINRELRDLDLKKNLELKVKLCEKAEELLLETSIIKSFKQLQEYHKEWKEMGPVPQEQSDEIWERFKTATDKINERRREHYGQMQEDQEKNLLAKTGLCEQAEELLTIIPDAMKGWQEQTNKMNELFKVWRSIGRAPKKSNTEIWERFKSSMNSFFANRKEFLNSIKQEQLNNYNLKVDLCVEAETLKDSTDWKQTTQQLIRLQQDWKKIGPVPRKHSDKIWKRFRAACDDFFNNKASHFSGIHENENENLAKKQKLIEKLKTHKFEDDKTKNLDILKNFQREWLAIGYVPMKEKEPIQKEFREAIDANLDKLKISSAELSSASYQTRMEAVKGSPDAERVYRKEIGFLSGKINKLRDDVNLWENNLGFFANSKKADILKQEFEQKIDKAKQDLAAMEAKVKYLRRMSAE
ncbi:MAG: DUF349 domain-containing protein, partial [Bacteroidetes bacterium]|nr:DUF349 domain-containing protein [Bacteroidota bacterium]